MRLDQTSLDSFVPSNPQLPGRTFPVNRTKAGFCYAPRTTNTQDLNPRVRGSPLGHSNTATNTLPLRNLS